MNMVSHQAVGVELYPKYILEFAKVSEITLIILGSSKFFV
jgi:hypothetical protein